MTKHAIVTLLSCVAGLLALPLRAQTVPGDLRVPGGDSLQVVILADGTRLVGRVTELLTDSVVFVTPSANTRIAVSNVSRITVVPASSVRDGVYWVPSSHTTRLFFGPTARMLPAGTGYFADHWVFLPSVNYGFTPNVTLGAGLSIVPGVGLDEQLLFVTPKVGMSVGDRTHLAAGAIIAHVPDAGTAGILFGAVTMGGDESGLTLGLGHGFVDGDLADRPMLMVGADVRVSRRFTLVTENWVFPGVDQPLGSYGVRFLGEKLSVDFAFVTPLGDDFLVPGIPLIGFALPF